MEVTFKPTDRGWCKPSRGAQYCAHTTKVFRTWFGKGLRHIRLPNGRILTRYDWIDEFLEKFEVVDDKTPASLPDQVAKVTGAFKRKMTRGHRNEKKTNRGDPHPAGTGMDHKRKSVSSGT